MDYREEIETALARDSTRLGKVWRGQTEGMRKYEISRVWKQLDVMLKRRKVETTLGQKKRWVKVMNEFAQRHCLSQITAAEIARRAEQYIVGR